MFFDVFFAAKTSKDIFSVKFSQNFTESVFFFLFFFCFFCFFFFFWSVCLLCFSSILRFSNVFDKEVFKNEVC